jgi:hypothetical protein
MNGIKVTIYLLGHAVAVSPSIVHAAVATNISTTTVRKLIKEGGTCNGYAFAKAKEE